MNRRRSRGLPALSLIAALLAAMGGVALTGCGGSGSGRPRLTVSAATSLKAPLTGYAADFDQADVRLSFAGSDQLAAQIRLGARPDVFASADEDLPAALHREGLVDRPVRFATNRLVAVMVAGGKVRRFADLAKPGIRIAAGSPSVPVGAYARRAIAALPQPQRRAITGNIATEEPDVAAVIARVRGGAVDAGFAYVTDARAVPELRTIDLPVQVTAAYAVAVVRSTKHPDEARRFVRGLLAGAGRDALLSAGFGPAAP
ncbi:MAG: molybdate transport system substrate-binding protein [Thermoleophilaceae bacterium]|nr:molybdate transport system substrate-binding protein [Thermoleophilaceae bacterium]